MRRTCEKCGQWWPPPYHRCKPVYLVWCDSDGETEADAVEVRATDAEDAAESMAETQDADSAEYSIVGGQDATFTVKAPGGTVTRWTVSGESVPSYSAREVKS